MENTKEVSIKKILVTIAGPAVNMFIIILNKIYVLKTGNLELFSIGIEEIIYANLLLFIFNMLPIYPLDGGRILKEIINLFCGVDSAYEVINKISNVTIIALTLFASLLILKYKNIAIVAVILYLWIVVICENKEYNIKHKILEQYILK